MNIGNISVIVNLDVGVRFRNNSIFIEGGHMFDLRAALESLNGNQYEFDELQRLLRKIRLEHLDEISPEIGTRELLVLAQERHWIYEDESGQFHVNVAQAA